MSGSQVWTRLLPYGRSGTSCSPELELTQNLLCLYCPGLRPIVSMGRPSTVRFGGRRAAGATAGKRAREPPSSVLSFKAINQVMQNVLQVHMHQTGVTCFGATRSSVLPTHTNMQLFCGLSEGTQVGVCQLLSHVQ